MEAESTERALRRKLLFAYGVIGVLALLLVLSWTRSGPEPESAAQPDEAAPEAAQTGYQESFDTCLAELSAGRGAEALPACERAVELQPDNLGARHNLGYAYRITGSPERAIEQLERVIDGDPLNARSRYELGSALADAGRTAEARAAFQAVLEIQPNHGWAQKRLQELGN